ncbi:unnamed protein product [Nezara viridula]|uniref:Uncharacterized protein n=1 Tax=Nezara viridula TaxID=85310 RepID=A0A9P0HGI5_NEZVI|nr:unnamed protein product [Nezara viridula]
MNLCKFEDGEIAPACPKKRKEPPEVLSYQQQILAQAKSLGQLRRHYVARKCYENKIDERKALEDICRYKTCYPCSSELQLLEILIKNKACPDTIIYQTYIVEADRGKCSGADETFRKLKQKTPASVKRRLIRPCCDEDDPLGSSQRKGRMPQPEQRSTPIPQQRSKPIPQQRPRPTPQQRSTARPQQRFTPAPRGAAGAPRPQPMYQGSPCPVGPPRQTPRPPCSPCAVPASTCPGPRPPYPPPITRLTPCEKSSVCPIPQRERPIQASTPIAEGGASYFGSPDETPAFLLSPGDTPVTVCKRKTRIPIAIRQDLSKSQKRQARDTTGSRIPCPISTQVPRSTRFSRVQITFGGTQVSYFEDTLQNLVGETRLEDTEFLAAPLSPAMLARQPQQFQEYKSMIDQEKKEIREMHNVVTQLMDRPEKVEFKDMYSLVPQISYLEETLTETAPEVAAAMLHSDELGLNLKSPPTEVYNTLFKGGDMDKTLIKVTPEENAKKVMNMTVLENKMNSHLAKKGLSSSREKMVGSLKECLVYILENRRIPIKQCSMYSSK